MASDTETIYRVVRFVRGKRLPGDTLFATRESAVKHANFFLACDVGEDRRTEIHAVPQRREA